MGKSILVGGAAGYWWDPLRERVLVRETQWT
jgi:hypothetical protein